MKRKGVTIKNQGPTNFKEIGRVFRSDKPDRNWYFNGEIIDMFDNLLKEIDFELHKYCVSKDHDEWHRIRGEERIIKHLRESLD